MSNLVWQKVPETIRYQLLHRTASAIIEAKRFNAKSALIIVHSFYSDHKIFVEGKNYTASPQTVLKRDVDHLLNLPKYIGPLLQNDLGFVVSFTCHNVDIFKSFHVGDGNACCPFGMTSKRSFLGYRVCDMVALMPRKKKESDPDSKFLNKTNILTTICVAFVTLFMFGGSTIREIGHIFGSNVSIVVREEKVIRQADHDDFQLAFSVVNRRKEKLYVNNVELKLGDFMSDGDVGFGVAVTKIDKRMKVALVRDANSTNVFHLIAETLGPDSMGKIEFQLSSGRVVFEPNEQLDFHINVEVKRPKELANKYRSIWQLGARITVESERLDLKQQTLDYPLGIGDIQAREPSI